MKKRKACAAPYLYLLPAAAFLLVVLGIPLFNMVWYAFADIDVMLGFRGWVGLQNFSFIADPVFHQTLARTAVWVVFGVAGIFLYGMAVALALNKPIPGRGLFRVVVIIPWLIPHAFAGTIWIWLLNSNTGLINAVLMATGLVRAPVSFLGEELAMATVIFIRVWKGAPFLIMSLLAAFQTIPAEMEEAATIDGAGCIRYFWHILLPLLRPVLVVSGIILTAWTITIFDIVYIITQGGPSKATEILSITIYNKAFIENNLGGASAISLFAMVLIVLLGYLQMRGQDREEG